MAEWQAAMRDRKSYNLSIMEDGYSGNHMPLCLTGEGITVINGNLDDDELTPIKSSEMEIELLCLKDRNPYAALYTDDPKKYQVTLSRVEGGKRRTCWRGYLNTGEYAQPYDNPPYAVRLRANDGFSILKTTPYLQDDGKRYAGTITIKQLLTNLLQEISPMSVNILPYNKIYANQTEHTFNLLSVSHSAIYVGYDSEPPSCYDVLERLTRSLGVHVYQEDGVWIVRSLSYLAEGRTTPTKLLALNGSRSNSYGVSTSAQLSILPPLKSLETQYETGDEISIAELSDASNWAGWGRTASERVIIRADRGKVRIDMNNGDVSGYANCMAIGLYPYTLAPADNVGVSVSGIIYNRDSKDSGIRVGLWLCDSAVSSAQDLYNDVVKIGWDKENEQWISVQSLTQDVLLKTSNTLDIKASEMDIVGRFTPVKGTTTTDFTVTLPKIPKADNVASWKLVLVLLERGGLPDPNIAIGSITMSVNETAEANEDLNTTIEISPNGIDSLEYSPMFSIGSMSSVSLDTVVPGLIDTSKGTRVGRIISPASHGDLPSMLGNSLKVLRGSSSRQLEGEIYRPEDITLSTIWEDTTDKRKYYTNYCKWLLRRGLVDAQLREIGWEVAQPQEPDASTTPWSSSCALDNCIYYVPRSGNGVYRYDVGSRTHKLIIDSVYPCRISPGYNCVCVAESSPVDGSPGNLYALDNSGEIISYVERLEIPNMTEVSEAYLLSARYNASTSQWIMCNGRTVVILSDVGSFVSRTLLNTTGVLANPEDFIVYNDGYVAALEDKDATIKNIWHSFQIHKPEDYGEIAISGKIVHVNDVFIAVQTDDHKCAIFEREKAEITFDPMNPLYVSNVGREFAGANCALAIAAVAGNVAIYDVRDGRTTAIVDGGKSTTFHLIGDTVYILGAKTSNSFQATRIIPQY